ncbi:MAG: glycosyltransferase [Bifidobacterium sp.]
MTGEMQSPDALISVIVPVYKAEQTLDRCVGSIVSQTLTVIWKSFLLSDGSPDDCPAMCDTWSVKKMPASRVVHQKNGGVTKARNTGLACATGDLLAWVDSDDWIDQQLFG